MVLSQGVPAKDAVLRQGVQQKGTSHDIYSKDVQKVQLSAAQVYHDVSSIPWMVKPLWCLLTDNLPLAGYRRRPYFVLAGEQHGYLLLVVFVWFTSDSRIQWATLLTCEM